MFCAHCGNAVNPDAEFCIARGTAITRARSGRVFNVSVQGVDESITCATGDYDSIDLAEPLDADALEQLLLQLQGLRVSVPSPQQDFCPPHAVIDTGSGSFQFHLEEGALVCAQTGSRVSVEQALQLVCGAVSKEALRPRRAYPRGMRPLKKPELAPAFWEDLNASDIDTGPASPQSSQIVWKGPAWALISLGLIVLGGTILALTLAVAAGGVSARDKGGVVLGIILGAGMIGAGLLARFPGRAALRTGVDWKTNTLWFLHNGKTSFEPHANCIRELLPQRLQRGNRFGAGNPLPAPGSSETWVLNVVYADGFTTTAMHPRLATGSDARAVARLALQVIESAS